MGLVGALRGKAHRLGGELRRSELVAVEKAFVVAQRSLAPAGVTLTRRDVWETRAPPPPEAPSMALDVRTAADGQLDGVCAVAETPPAVVRDRLRRGDLVYVGIRDQRILGHVWFHRGPRPFAEDERVLARWALGPTTFWAYAAAAVGDIRSSGILVEIFQAALQDLFQLHGAERVLSSSGSRDQLARLLHERMGFQHLGTLTGVATPWLRSVVWHGEVVKSFVLGPNSAQALPLPP